MNSYPSEADLKRIETWGGTPRELVEYIGSLWSYRSEKDWYIRNGRDPLSRKVYKIDFSTWGWSGNEDILVSLEGTWFWMMFWWSSRRGGHYEVQIQPYWIDRKLPHGFGKILTTQANRKASPTDSQANTKEKEGM